MALTLTNLPQDVLILISLHLLVEDVLVLMQTCRVMHALGSLDYLWRALLSDWDVPLDIPLNASVASLPSNILRLAAVKSLRLDNKWRNPRLEMRRAQRIISQNFSFVDGMRLLPGGRWLVTFQYGQTSVTSITLWSIADLNDHKPIFKVTVAGRARSLHAHHHYELEQITIGVAFARGISEFIRVYTVFLQEGSSTRHSLIFEATPNELSSLGRFAGMKINGEVMVAVFVSLSSSPGQQGRVVCVNLVSRAAAVLECPDWSLTWGRLKLFRRYFSVITSRYTSQHMSAYLYFFEVPSAILDPLDCLSPRVPCWPEKLVIKSSPIASTSWSSDGPLIFELSDDVPTSNTPTCSFRMFGYPISTQLTNAPGFGINVLHVAFDGKDVERAFTVVPCRSIPSAGELRVSSSGRRAVWLSMNPDTHECNLIKFALGRIGNELGSCISTLVPSFSGLPFNPRDFHSFAFDELSCRIVVSLPTGELYVLHY